MSNLQQQQHQFAAYIRDPECIDAPQNIEQRRLHIYRDLFYNNIATFLNSGFPVLRSIIADDHWQTMVRDFMRSYRCDSPYFLEISQEFLRYLQEVREPHDADPPFMLELAHYEWVELALDVAKDDADQAVDTAGDLLEQRPVVSQLAWCLAYQFPVHRIGPAFQPEKPSTEPHYLLIYRNRSDKVGFIEANSVTARLLELLRQDDTMTGRDVLQQIASEIGHNASNVVDYGLQTLRMLRGLDIIIGTSIG